ncbi:MAG TPA: DMT family transporter [Caldilineaceae bacterium]|nr:DMT family transporter [Caldilineaceae bacterium]
MSAQGERIQAGGAAVRAAEERRGLYLVGLAVLAFSTSPVLVRWAAESLSPLEITAGRMLSAGAAVLALAWLTRQPLPGRQDWLRFAGYGLVAALHFGFYIASLAYTSIAHSLAITYTAPIFVALFSWFFLQEGLDRRKWLGTLVAVAGIAVLAGFEPAFTRRMVVGDLLALGSAICFGLYSVAGRSQRHRYGLFAYAGTVYMLAGLWLLPLALWRFSPGGYTLPAVASVLALGLLPLGLGHTLYNAALRRAPATYANLIATQEVTGGILLGVLLLGEMPSLNSLVGAAITLLGIALVIL